MFFHPKSRQNGRLLGLLTIHSTSAGHYSDYLGETVGMIFKVVFKLIEANLSRVRSLEGGASTIQCQLQEELPIADSRRSVNYRSPENCQQERIISDGSQQEKSSHCIFYKKSTTTLATQPMRSHHHPELVLSSLDFWSKQSLLTSLFIK